MTKSAGLIESLGSQAGRTSRRLRQVIVKRDEDQTRRRRRGGPEGAQPERRHPRLAKEAIEIAQAQGRFTIFAMVDALTRIAGKIVNAGDRVDVDQKAGQLLALAV